MPTLADVDLKMIEDAALRVKDIAWRTPLLPASRDSDAPLGASSPLAGARGDDGKLYLKMEALQRTGSFKLRGAWNRMSRCSEEEKRRGFVTVSAGNHGQAVAWSARALGAPCTVWVPEGAVQRKVDSMRMMGATVKALPHEEIMDAMKTPEFSRAEGATYVHPFGDPFVMAGQGTVGLEILRDLPTVGTVIIPVGGGGLACGIATVLQAMAPKVKVFGVQAEGANPLPKSFASGNAEATGAPRTFADGIGATRVFDYMWPLLRARLGGCFQVTDAELQRAVVHANKECHVTLEGAGAAALAAAWQHAGQLPGPIVCVASGGNLDPALLARFLIA